MILNLSVFHGVFIPGRDQAWFKNETKNMSRRQIAQELECNFNSSGENVLQSEDMEWVHSCVKDPVYRTGFDRNFWIWEKYQEVPSTFS